MPAAAVLFHHSWTMPEEQQQSEMTNSLKNIALAGGALAIGIFGMSSWDYSLCIGLFQSQHCSTVFPTHGELNDYSLGVANEGQLMVEKITLIEPHLEGAQFGPEMNDGEPESSTSDTSVSRKVPIFLLAVLIIGVVIGLARLRSNGEADDSIEIQEKAKESLPWSR